MSFFPFRAAPLTSKPCKTRGFLIVPRWNSRTAKATKHRKTRCFWTPWAEYTVNYKGSGAGEVSPRSPPWGRRQGRLATITFGYQPKASGQDTARLGSGRRPDWRATAHAADPCPGWCKMRDGANDTNKSGKLESATYFSLWAMHQTYQCEYLCPKTRQKRSATPPTKSA